MITIEEFTAVFGVLRMFPYLYLITVIFSLSFSVTDLSSLKRNVNSYFLFLFVCCYILFFFGLRGYIFTDWINYYAAYKRIPVNFSNFISYLKDPSNSWSIGFYILEYLCKRISESYFFLQFISFLIDFIILFFVFRDVNPSNILLCILCIISFKGLEIEVNLLRNSKSICLFLYSLRYIYKNKSFAKYLLLNLLGCSFHITAIVYIPVFFILDKRHTQMFLFTVCVACVAIMMLHISFSYTLFSIISNYIPEGKLLLRMSNYLGDGNKARVLSAISLERIFTFAILIRFYPILAKKKVNVVFINVFMLYFICAFCFWDFDVLSQRGAILFVAANWFLVPEIISLVGKKYIKLIILFVFLCYVGFKIYKDVNKSPWLSYFTCFNDTNYSVKSSLLMKDLSK